jgi:membrane-associated protein
VPTTAELLASRMLGPGWLDPQSLIESLGPWALVGITAIIFAECGLLVGFFLPGDSLLFVAGLLVARDCADGLCIDYPIALVCLIFTVAAITGNVVGYWIGRKAGPTIFRKPESKLFRREYVDRTQHFFDHYGARAIILARFIPIVRTFITVMAGVGRMNFRTYAVYSTIGGILWATGVTLLGYFLGNVAFIADNIEAILIGVVLVSVIPVVFEYIRHKRSGAPSGASNADPTDA